MNKLIALALLLTGPGLFAQKTDSVKNGNVSIYYQIYGKGPPVYILAGGPGLTPFYMLPVIIELSKTHQCVLVHQRGTGRTKFISLGNSDYIGKFCEDIHLIKSRMGHGRITVLGHSWGAMLAMNMVVEYPADVKKLILVSPGGYNLDFLGYFRSNIFAGLSLTDQKTVSSKINAQEGRGRKDSDSPMLSQVELTNIMVSGYFYNKELSKLINLRKGEINEESSAQVWKSLNDAHWDIGKLLKSVRVPALIIQGRQDPMDLQTAWQINKALTGSYVQVIEDCGHFPWIEQNKLFYKHIQSFLAK